MDGHMTNEPTVRNLLIIRMMQDFGEPREVGEGFHWTIIPKSERPRPAISVALNSWKNPESARLWVIDPRKTGLAGAQHFEVTEPGQVGSVMDEIHGIIYSED